MYWGSRRLASKNSEGNFRVVEGTAGVGVGIVQLVISAEGFGEVHRLSCPSIKVGMVISSPLQGWSCWVNGRE